MYVLKCNNLDLPGRDGHSSENYQKVYFPHQADAEQRPSLVVFRYGSVQEKLHCWIIYQTGGNECFTS